MKKLFLGVVALMLVNTAFAQLPPAVKDLLKKSEKARTTFENDNTKDVKLQEAIAAIDEALKTPEGQASAEVWLAKGRIYNAMGGADKAAFQAEAAKAQLTKAAMPTPKLKYLGEAIKAVEPFKNAIAKSVKKEAKLAAEELQFTQEYINMSANDYNRKNDYVKAQLSFRTVYDIHKILVAQKAKSILDDKANYHNQLYMAGAMATQGYANNSKDNTDIYKAMIEEKVDTLAFVYTALYEAYKETNDAEAFKYLEAGRARLPLDNGLMIAELNYYVKAGKLDVLVGKLKNAMVADPKNVSLVFFAGSISDQLAAKETDPAKKATLEAEAMTYYKKTLEMDAKNLEAVYSIGANIYNKAAAMTKELNELAKLPPNKENNKKYDEKEKEINAVFVQALPYFKKAESINPNDKNTLIALKEIFAKSNQLELAKEMTNRLMKLENGETNKSYFEGKD
ncbi:MAG: hypothetical protein RL757_460 [Bacteroidota bacterium]|jgi:hypothetical protein